MSPPAKNRSAGRDDIPSPRKMFLDVAGHDDSTLVLNHGQGAPGSYLTAVGSFDSWPPRFTFIPQYTMVASRSRQGRWAAACKVETGREHVRISQSLTEWEELPAQVPESRRVRWVDFIGERAVAVAHAEEVPPDEGDTRPPQWIAQALGVPGRDVKYEPAFPLIEQEGHLVPLEGLPGAEQTEDTPPHGVAHLGDGADVFFWKGTGYELLDGRFRATFAVDGNWMWRDQLVPFGDDGVFYVEYEIRDEGPIRLLRSATRGKPPVEHLEPYPFIHCLAPAPNDGVIVALGRHRLGDLGHIYFPHESEYLRITLKLFAGVETGYIVGLHWFKGCGRLVATTPHRIWSVPIERVLELPRYDAETGLEK